MEEFLSVHKHVFYEGQPFKDEHTIIEHRCRIENIKLNCETLVETVIEWVFKYTNVEGFQKKLTKDPGNLNRKNNTLSQNKKNKK